jgi:hypothetical protein
MLFGIILFWMAGIGILYRLFHFYERGIIFAAANVQCIKWIGMWLLEAWALSNAIEISKLVTHESADIDLRIDETVLVGLPVLLISRIMEEGGKIHAQGELFGANRSALPPQTVICLALRAGVATIRRC